MSYKVCRGFSAVIKVYYNSKVRKQSFLSLTLYRTYPKSPKQTEAGEGIEPSFPPVPAQPSNHKTPTERSERQIKDIQLDRHLLSLLSPKKYPFLISAVIFLRQLAMKCEKTTKNSWVYILC